MRLLMVAPPGAGKGTQAKLLASHYRIAHISSGEVFRGEVAAGTELGRTLASYLARGDLVPDDLVLHVLRQPVIDAAAGGGYVLDGFPRTLRQAEEAYEVAKQISGIELQAVVHLVVPREELLRRLRARSGAEVRGDDSEAIFEHRLDVYDSETEPMLEFYAGRGLVVDIDGFQPVTAVFEDIIKAVDALRAGLR
ncbi:MAG TPA: adenylate kinase [Acidimicrobiales bacterium]|nr:adenylate kinase [Acidimicrobiales bacterium]